MAIEMAIKNHPALRTIIRFTEEGDLVQQYDPDLKVALTIEKISNSEFEKIKDTLFRPFKIVNSPLFRCQLFETEDSAYLFFDVHHILFDGTSFKVFMNTIMSAYMGAPLEKDYYFLVLQKREQMELTDFYTESCRYFEEKYGNVNWTGRPKIDTESRENKLGALACAARFCRKEVHGVP